MNFDQFCDELGKIANQFDWSASSVSDFQSKKYRLRGRVKGQPAKNWYCPMTAVLKSRDVELPSTHVVEAGDKLGISRDDRNLIVAASDGHPGDEFLPARVKMFAVVGKSEFV